MEFCPKCGSVLVEKDGKFKCARCSFKPKGKVKIQSSETLVQKEKVGVVKEKDVDEVVDNLGNYIKGEKFGDLDSKGVTSNSTSDEVVKTGAGQMGTHGVDRTHTTLRFWAENDMSKALGYEDTLGQDEDYEDAKGHFEDELGLDEPEAEERLAKMGYDKKLPDDKVRLVENPRKFVEEYLESILSKKTDSRDFVKKTDIEEKEINPIILKQINALKNTLKNNNISFDDVMKHLKDNE
jgi:uncharacterized Zn finger protein (UPF0148 family)